MNFGKSIRLFLIEGIPDGRWMCELSNWTGKAYKIPRTYVKSSCDRQELKNTGIYFLFGKDDESGIDQVYIGEAENIYSRLMQHLSEKDFWNECVVFISKDNNLNKAHVKYLENKIYTLAKEAGRYKLTNSNTPTLSSLSESDGAEMDEFIENAKLLLSAVGHKVLENATGSLLNGKSISKFYLESSGFKANGSPTSDGFVIYKGSKISNTVASSLTKSVISKRQNLIDTGIIDSNLTFTQDFLFSSPSIAAAIVVGYSINGRIAWKTTKGISLKEFES
ncbi:GIY-YIG nuclease family protein [Anaerocolumna xylanovorans]|uniref:GIY-YIG catalytic domain-containing protein n=1 Tax=Anaerocolumna xylanovorans DSM 12503 TaxID=1121345 RepID=A0A1M7Y820_9FIRM|nr:GIY-YIG nuclease family protein [Anaerocolumna xylanovorans]SHO48706.1 GIY-YIG catalytic domain-containing protein [Anaerocolumna xylanovorans DSM 12503]